MAERCRGQGSEQAPANREAAPRANQPLLPPKAEAALREAGLWTERFVRELPRLDRAALDALSVLGAWDDLDWEEMAAAFERMRHENPPSPPAEQ